MRPYICMGRHLTVAQKRQDLEARIAALQTRSGSVKGKGARAPLEAKIKQLRGELATLNGKNGSQSLGRRGCGYDLTEQIEAIPADGEVYEYECPACGNKGTAWTAPPDASEAA